MATVWAYRIGAWTRSSTTGWSHSFQFESLADLNQQLEEEQLNGLVRRLAIVAHGDSGGLIQLDRPLTLSSFSTFVPELGRLRWYLTTHAMVEFYSCIMAQGEAGSTLLNQLSATLLPRTVVGFTVYGSLGNTPGIPSHPGIIDVSVSGEPSSGTRMTLWGPFAKWSFRGVVVRWPVTEQQFRAGNRCGNPRCRGHGSPADRCRGWAPTGLQQHHP